MRLITSISLSMAALAAAAPAPIQYGPPKGGWESIDWDAIDYPKGTGANAVPEGGWDSVDYSKSNTDAACPPAPPTPFHFTSTYVVHATPDQVVNGTTPTGGLPGAMGLYVFGINSAENMICYNITLHGFKGDYASPAKTATHIHEAAKGQSGSPRIAFPNPVGEGEVRSSVGCLTGPFTTGVMAGGKDSGEGFHVGQIEKNPAGFFADVHSSLAVPGAVRGQLA